MAGFRNTETQNICSYDEQKTVPQTAEHVSLHEDVNTVLLDFTPCSLANMYQHFGEKFHPRVQEKRSRFDRKGDSYLPEYFTIYARGL